VDREEKLAGRFELSADHYLEKNGAVPSRALYSCIVLLSVLAIIIPTGLSGKTVSGSDHPYTYPLTSELNTTRFVSDTDDAYSVFLNPAGLALRRHPSSLISGTYSFNRFEDLTISVADGNIGLGFNYINLPFFTSKGYFLSIATPFSRYGGIGTTLKWLRTSEAENRSPFVVDVGLLLRPMRYLSIGAVWRNASRADFSGGSFTDELYGEISRLEERYDVGVSIRPLTERITLSAQCEAAENHKPGWRFGARFIPVDGIELFGSYAVLNDWPGGDPYREFSMGLAFTLEATTLRSTSRSSVDGDYERSRNSFCIERKGAFVRNSIAAHKKFVEINISGNYLDEGGGFSLLGSGARNLHTILKKLDSAARDRDISGVLLKIGHLSGSFVGPISANLYEIRRAILRVKEAHKPIVAYLDTGGSSAELYLASAADRIVVPHEGTVGLLGVSLEISRLKRMFEKLGIEWDHYTAGDYKSTFHTYYTDTTTAVQREEIESLVMESFKLLVSAIAEGRGINLERMKELADGRVFLPDELIKERLVDRIGWEDDAREELGKLAGLSEPRKLKTVKMPLRRYWSDRWTEPPAIAIVGAYGSILSGESGRNIITGSRIMGSKTVVRQLKAASRYPGVRAIVFRVDSPGGSGLASDEILNEIRRIKKEKKIPVIVSMGNIAGSGGYWISALADAIFADPFTITGSIGVVFMKPVFTRLYEKAGITNEVFKSSEHADALSYSRKMTEEEMKLLGAYIDHAYETFVKLVAEGRGMDVERVKEIARGRVYFGTQAKEINLVDEIGGLNDAVRFAAKKAGVEGDYRTVYFKAFPGFFEKLKEERGVAGTVSYIFNIITGKTSSGFEETVYVK